jgi:hypothetical protein
MKNIILFLSCVCSCHVFAQQEKQHTFSYPAINELGSNTFKGFKGGLYPEGKNEMPEIYAYKGIHIAKSIVPLNEKGEINKKGKIVFLSIGMSNTTMEFRSFLQMTDTLKTRNDDLTLIDGAIGGYDIKKITHPSTDYWQKVNERLKEKGNTRHQVQIVWFKEAEAGSKDRLFPDHALRMKGKFNEAVKILSVYFPNLKMIYLSSRIYAGYATVSLNPEPYAYYSGWSVKWLIEDQINKSQLLGESEQNELPFLAWGPYLWADGKNERKDGIFWEIDDFAIKDRTHPSKTGIQKVADMLFHFFTTDPTASYWFLDN